MKTRSSLLIVCFITLLSSCQQTVSNPTQPEKGMIKVTLLYPGGEGNTFDMDYYTKSHMPMVADALGEALKFYKIDKGVAGRTPDEPVPYMAIGYLYFDKLSDYESSFGPNAQKIISDIPNYTNVQPTLLISQVVE